MKERLSLRIEISRLEKLRLVSEDRKKTMTQLVEDWIDRLPNPKSSEEDAKE
jgi:hypothetical protein